MTHFEGEIRIGHYRALPYGRYRSLTDAQRAEFHGTQVRRPAPIQPSAVATRRDTPVAVARPAHSTIRPPTMRPASPPRALATGTQVTAAPAKPSGKTPGQQLMNIAAEIARTEQVTFGVAFQRACERHSDLWREHCDSVSRKGKA